MARIVTRAPIPALTCANLINNLINYEQDPLGDVRVILTVTLNPAVDVTYLVDRLVLSSATRVAQVRQRAGGKGVNVARVAGACGADVCATGLAGGSRGELILAGLAGQGVRADFEPIAGESRQTLTIVETRPRGTGAEDAAGRVPAGHGGAAGHPTELREIGPTVTPAEWERFVYRFTRLAAEAAVAVLSGSLPPGVPADGYATLTAIARQARASVIVDAGGSALRLACAAGPDIVKPNEAELLAAAKPDKADGRDGAAGGDVAGRAVPGVQLLLTAASGLRGLGAAAVVASLGRAGSLAVTSAGRWRVSHEPVPGNPVGAGDALVAGLALNLAGSGGSGDRPASGVREWGDPQWRRALALASGLAMASLLCESAGEVDPDAAASFSEKIRIRALGGRRT